MRNLNPLRVLLLVAVALPLVAVWSQDPAAAVDWAKEVDRACASPRYGLRIAAGRKVASAGRDAVPAISDYSAKKGVNALTASLIEAIADEATLDEAVWRQLAGWAQNRDFYWRAQAMRGLALRAPKLSATVQAELRPIFESFRDDAAWLMRTHARLGLVLLGDEAAAARPESDPRAKPRLTALLLANGKMPPLQPLIDALADERTFLGVPWAQATGQQAYDALKAWLAEEHPLAAGGSFPDKEQGMQRLVAAIAKKSGQQLSVPPVVGDPAPPLESGFEILSCKHGDVFVRWTDDGVVRAGIDGRQVVQIPTRTWIALTKEREALRFGDRGTVICDAMRLCWTTPSVHVKVAPESLPAAATTWLQNLARAIEDAGSLRLAESLRAGVSQFAAH